MRLQSSAASPVRISFRPARPGVGVKSSSEGNGLNGATILAQAFGICFCSGEAVAIRPAIRGIPYARARYDERHDEDASIRWRIHRRSDQKLMQKKRKWVTLSAGLAAFVILGIFGTSWARIVAWYEFRSLFENLGRNSQGYGEYRHRGTGIVMVCLPGGECDTGSPPGHANRKGDEGPVQPVTLIPFWVAK